MTSKDSLAIPLEIFKVNIPLNNNGPLLVYNKDRTIQFQCMAYEVTGVFNRNLMSLFGSKPKIYVYANTKNGQLCIHGQAVDQGW